VGRSDGRLLREAAVVIFGRPAAQAQGRVTRRAGARFKTKTAFAASSTNGVDEVFYIFCNRSRQLHK
jgi:hypothetical protein